MTKGKQNILLALILIGVVVSVMYFSMYYIWSSLEVVS